MNTGAATPANQQKNRNPVNIGIGKRSQRIDSIPLSRILHIHAARTPGSQIMAGRKSHRSTLVGRDNMRSRADVIL